MILEKWVDISYEMQKIRKGMSCWGNGTDLEKEESMRCLLTLAIQNGGTSGIMGIGLGKSWSPSRFQLQNAWVLRVRVPAFGQPIIPGYHIPELQLLLSQAPHWQSCEPCGSSLPEALLDSPEVPLCKAPWPSELPALPLLCCPKLSFLLWD